MTKIIHYNCSFYTKTYTFRNCLNTEIVSYNFNVASLKLYYRILFTQIDQYYVLLNNIHPYFFLMGHLWRKEDIWCEIVCSREGKDYIFSSAESGRLGDKRAYRFLLWMVIWTKERTAESSCFRDCWVNKYVLVQKRIPCMSYHVEFFSTWMLADGGSCGPLLCIVFLHR
jgi:hypothetical protein